jgi:hypothetical protein
MSYRIGSYYQNTNLDILSFTFLNEIKIHSNLEKKTILFFHFQ